MWGVSGSMRALVIRSRMLGWMGSRSRWAGSIQAGLAGFVVVGVGLPVDGQGVEADGELLAGLAGVGVDHDVAGVGVDPGEAGHVDRDATFFGDFAFGGGGG